MDYFYWKVIGILLWNRGLLFLFDFKVHFYGVHNCQQRLLKEDLPAIKKVILLRFLFSKSFRLDELI